MDDLDNPAPLSTGERAHELPVRDVRDLALAVIEGAVAAESLAQELRKTPDRSRHFQEIAERLRGVVERPSIRAALAGESAAVTVTPDRVPLRVAPTAELEPAMNWSSEQPKNLAPQLERVESILRLLAERDRGERLGMRLARLEELVGLALAQRDDGERVALRSAEDAIALAARLAERLRRDGLVTVRIGP